MRMSLLTTLLRLAFTQLSYNFVHTSFWVHNEIYSRKQFNFIKGYEGIAAGGSLGSMSFPLGNRLHDITK